MRVLLTNLCGLALVIFMTGVAAAGVELAENVSRPAPANLRSYSRQLRVDLRWDELGGARFEVQRATNRSGPFLTLTAPLPAVPIFSDFVGVPAGEFFYRVRSIATNEPNRDVLISDWSAPVSGTPLPLNTNELLTEVQEASFRYFYDFAHPVSGLAREGTGFFPDFCATGASGMGLFNLAVGVERGFITRQQGEERVLKILRFLTDKAERFHGAFPHFLNGKTGKANPFFRDDDGADIVETAFLMQGVLFVREYFAATNACEAEIRQRADALWRDVEWDWFAHEEGANAALVWHWSPTRDWQGQLRITGFNECHIVYLLALASPTHAIPIKFYQRGWESAHFGASRERFGIPLELGRDFGPPLFWTHFSYLGLDPERVIYRHQSYLKHFQNLCQVQVRYAVSKPDLFGDQSSLWGITSSKGPDGYKAFAPGLHDNGTLAPTAALSSMPYVPEASMACLVELYAQHGAKLWGPFGFFDAFNLSRNWTSSDYLGIDVGPIAPMVENYRTGLCWKTFMTAPEIRQVVKRLAETTEKERDLSFEKNKESAVERKPL